MNSFFQEKPYLVIAFAAILSTGCENLGYRALKPVQSANFQIRGSGVSAKVETLHADFVQPKASYQVDVQIKNERNEAMRVEPDRIRLAVLAKEKTPITVPKAPPAVDIGSPAGAVVGGARAGSSVGQSVGSTGVGGGIIGAGAGIAVAALVLLPIAVYVIIDAAVLEGEKDLDPGETGTYRIQLPGIPIDDGKPYGLLIDGAIGVPDGTVEPLMLVRPDAPHSGYGTPADPRWVFVGRLGGGAIRRAPYTAGLGGFEIFMGRQFGHLSIGAFGTLGAGAWGGEVRYRFDPGRYVSIVPFVGYGYYPIVGILGFNAGHGARAGFELQFSLGESQRLGYSRTGTRLGIYAHTGPTFLRAVDGVGLASQFGMCFGFL